MNEALTTLILIAGLVNLAVIALLGMLAVFRLMPRKVTHPVQSRKEASKSEAVRKERKDVGTIQS